MLAPVILVHGLRTSATMWRAQVEALEALGIPVLTIDLPGHGGRIGQRFTLSDALASIGEAVVTATSRFGGRPYLVGFSLGGYLAVEWVAAHPDAVCGLLAAGCGTRPYPVIICGWRLIAKAIHRLPDRGRGLNDFALRRFASAAAGRDVLAGGIALEVMDDVLRSLATLSPADRLPLIEVPVLFVNGRFDHVGLQAGRFVKATRQGRLVTVPRATHLVSLNRPQEFTRALLEGYAEATGTSVPAVSDDRS